MDITLQIFLILSCSSSVFLLDIRLPPEIIHEPAVKVPVKFGTLITLPCISTGIPEVTFTWKFTWNSNTTDATDMKYHKVLSNGNNGSLVIENPQPKHADGTYRCFAKNDFGETMSNEISLQEASYFATGGHPLKPVFTVRPNRNYFVLNCDIPSVSTPKAITKWRFSPNISSSRYTMLNNTQHSMVNVTGSLWISHIRQADIGKYCCVEYHSMLDLINREQCTTVSYGTREWSEPEPFAPVITNASTPSNITVQLGDPYTIQCLFSGKPDPVVTWTFIPENWRLDIDNLGTSISNDVVYFSDSGIYTCVGSNSISPNATYSIQLNVIADSKPAFGNRGDKPNRKTVIENVSSVEIYCKTVTISNVSITTDWYIDTIPFDSFDVSSKPNIKMQDGNTTLVIYNPTKNSSLMSIQCKASNENGSVYAQGYLNVIFRTTIQTSDCNLLLLRGKDAFFDCVAIFDDGFPGTVDWRHKNSTVNNGSGYEIYPNNTLHIITSGDSDGGISKQGEYMCIATNGLSRADKTCNLKFEPWDWWKCLLATLGIILFILLILLILLIFRKYRQGESYPVDKKERKNGNDPVNDLKDADFHHATNVSNDRDNLISPNVMSGYGVDERDFSYPAYHDEVSNYPYNPHEANGFQYDPMNDKGNEEGSIRSNGNGNPYSSVGKLNNQVTLV